MAIERVEMFRVPVAMMTDGQTVDWRVDQPVGYGQYLRFRIEGEVLVGTVLVAKGPGSIEDRPPEELPATRTLSRSAL